MSNGVCIIASMGWGVRNVLLSRAIDIIAREREVHVLSTFNHVPAFRDRFADLASLSELQEIRLDRSARWLYEYSAQVFYKMSPSITHQQKRRRSMARFNDKARNRLAVQMSGRGMLRMAQRAMVARLRTTPAYERAVGLFRSLGVSTVVSSNPLNIHEYPALVAAADLGLETVAIITSWDNLTSKQPYVIPFDLYLVWNQGMAREVEQFYRGRTEEIGPLQFDFYFDPRFKVSREAFCAQYDFDPGKPIFVHSSVTKGILRSEPQVVAGLLEAVRSRQIPHDCNVLVRLHPKRRMEEFEAVRQDARWKSVRVGWTVAGAPVRSSNDMWCPLDDEMRQLAGTVLNGDVNTNAFSTMMLDFAVAEKPAVLIAYRADGTMLDYQNYEHLKPVIESAAFRIAHDEAEAVKHVSDYLQTPELDAAHRQELVRQQGGPYLGSAWRRLAEVLLGREVPDDLEEPAGSASVGTTAAQQ